MPERNWSTDWYRYGWGGHEKDDAIKGKHNSIATYFRMNDPRTGRWFSMDPMTQFSQSPFASMGNNPINMIDPFGAYPDSPLGPAEESGGFWSDIGQFFSDIGNAFGEMFTGNRNSMDYNEDNPWGPITPEEKKSEPAFNPSFTPSDDVPAHALLGLGMQEFVSENQEEILVTNTLSEGFIEMYSWVPGMSLVVDLGLSQGWIISNNYSKFDGHLGLALAPATILGNNLIKKGFKKLLGYHAHHIVPWDNNYSSAIKARKILKKFGIDINDADNGVFLRGNKKIIGETAPHANIHTHKYMDNVLKELEDAQSEQHARYILRDIGNRLSKNEYPYKRK